MISNHWKMIVAMLPILGSFAVSADLYQATNNVLDVPTPVYVFAGQTGVQQTRLKLTQNTNAYPLAGKSSAMTWIDASYGTIITSSGVNQSETGVVLFTTTIMQAGTYNLTATVTPAGQSPATAMRAVLTLTNAASSGVGTTSLTLTNIVTVTNPVPVNVGGSTTLVANAFAPVFSPTNSFFGTMNFTGTTTIASGAVQVAVSAPVVNATITTGPTTNNIYTTINVSNVTVNPGTLSATNVFAGAYMRKDSDGTNVTLVATGHVATISCTNGILQIARSTNSDGSINYDLVAWTGSSAPTSGGGNITFGTNSFTLNSLTNYITAQSIYSWTPGPGVSNFTFKGWGAGGCSPSGTGGTGSEIQGAAPCTPGTPVYFVTGKCGVNIGTSAANASNNAPFGGGAVIGVTNTVMASGGGASVCWSGTAMPSTNSTFVIFAGAGGSASISPAAGGVGGYPSGAAGTGTGSSLGATTTNGAFAAGATNQFFGANATNVPTTTGAAAGSGGYFGSLNSSASTGGAGGGSSFALHCIWWTAFRGNMSVADTDWQSPWGNAAADGGWRVQPNGYNLNQ